LTPYGLRGGSWFTYSPDRFCVAYRDVYIPDLRYFNIGFRVVLCSQGDPNP